MNDSNYLRSWTPRRPSPNLRARIFSAAPHAGGAVGPEAFLPPWRWWAPAMAMMIAALTLLSGQFSALNFQNGSRASLLATGALNHPDLVAYLPTAGHSEANAWPSASFEWTNQGHLVSYTNGLMQ